MILSVIQIRYSVKYKTIIRIHRVAFPDAVQQRKGICFQNSINLFCFCCCSISNHDRPFRQVRTANEDHDRHEDQEDQHYEEQSLEDGHQEDQREDDRQQEQIHTHYPEREPAAKYIGGIQEKHGRGQHNRYAKSRNDAKEADEVSNEQVIEHIDHAQEKVVEGIEFHGEYL